jgi:hypothetical protein
LDFFLAKGKQWPAALINIKQENVDQIEADNGIRRSGVRIYRNKYNFKNLKRIFQMPLLLF